MSKLTLIRIDSTLALLNKSVLTYSVLEDSDSKRYLKINTNTPSACSNNMDAGTFPLSNFLIDEKYIQKYLKKYCSGPANRIVLPKEFEDDLSPKVASANNTAKGFFRAIFLHHLTIESIK